MSIIQINTKEKTVAPIDIACIGAGPANLSLAALGQHGTSANIALFDGKNQIDWHADAIFDDSDLQTSFLEDLVTPIDPTHPLSFLNFLSKKGRMYQFLCFDASQISRIEFEQYFQWAAEQLRSLHLNNEVQEVAWDGNQFTIHTSQTKVVARAISIGVGVKAYMPEWAIKQKHPNVYHAWDITKLKPDFSGKRIALIGGGQTAVEVAITLLNGSYGKFSKLSWINRRPSVVPMDHTPFVNEFFSPQYVRYFSGLQEDTRRRIARANRLFCDGASPDSTHILYTLLYNHQHVHQSPNPVELILDHEVSDMTAHGHYLTLRVLSNADQLATNLDVDVVILATGCHRPFPAFLEGLRDRFDLIDDEFNLDANYRVKWDGPSDAKIYAQNRGRNTHGIGDNTFCLLAWRSAVILNDYLGRDVFDTFPVDSAINWQFGRNDPNFSQRVTG